MQMEKEKSVGAEREWGRRRVRNEAWGYGMGKAQVDFLTPRHLYSGSAEEGLRCFTFLPPSLPLLPSGHLLGPGDLAGGSSSSTSGPE